MIRRLKFIVYITIQPMNRNSSFTAFNLNKRARLSDAEQLQSCACFTCCSIRV